MGKTARPLKALIACFCSSTPISWAVVKPKATFTATTNVGLFSPRSIFDSMARQLLRAGFDLTVYNRTLKKAASLTVAATKTAATHEVYQLAGNQGLDSQEYSAVLEVLKGR